MKFTQKIASRIRRAANSVLGLDRGIREAIRKLDEVKFNQGVILATLNQQRDLKKISDYEFKVFSQWGEDGIIQYLTSHIEIKNKTFIEFGVEDFSESNCRFLMMKDDWKGFVIDGSKDNIERLRSSYFFWRHHLVAKHAFVTKENINNLLFESGFHEDLGILSIDIDGVDYFVLESILGYRPRILITEYNPVFGEYRRISVPYSPEFLRTHAHHSNLYFGASLAGMTHLAERKGYALVGGGTTGSNAFFVREDLLNDRVQRLPIEEVFRSSNCRESRDKCGNLTYLTGEERLQEIKGLPVVNVETGEIERL